MIEERLEEEFSLVARQGMAGFLLLYREIALIAQGIMEERGLTHPETPLEERPPGRGRGSSVALLTGYLIGISHVDPLRWDLTLERFISEDTSLLPDIDLDFPRGLRDELIQRVHRRFGPNHAVLVGAIATYSVKGIVQDMGKALGLPKEDLRLLSKTDPLPRRRGPAGGDAGASSLQGAGGRPRLARPPGDGAPADARPQEPGTARRGHGAESFPHIRHGPGAGGGHAGPVHNGLEQGQRGRCQLRQDRPPLSASAGPAWRRRWTWWRGARGMRPDLARLDPEDSEVYDMINEGRSKGVFLLQSPAQLKMAQRLRSRCLLDLAYQVALIRPGVGVQGSAVSQFVERYRHGVTWEYDHPLERRALERGCGIIVWQEQVVQLIMDVAGMTAAQADEVRRAFSRPNAGHLITMHRQRFMVGALGNGVPEEIALKIFDKINGHYMFPESHSHAFAVTAYQAAWLKRYHPLEFFVTLVNNQPMGFYPLETIKEDARRFGVTFLNPSVNRSQARCIPDGGYLLLGLGIVKDVGEESAVAIVEERDRHGPYLNPADLVRRTGLKPQAVLSLVMAGAFDGLNPNRREALWEAGLSTRPSRNGQRAFPVSVEEGAPELADFTAFERMAGEYRVMGIYPRGHLMEFVRPRLSADVLPASAVEGVQEGRDILVAGWPVARQHPRGKEGTVFVTIEDETGDVQLILWPRVFTMRRGELGSQVILVRGVVSRWDGTTNVVVSDLRRVDTGVPMPDAHDWR